MVFELCKVRTNLLQLDEETILILVKAKIKKQGMALGGEFRRHRNWAAASSSSGSGPSTSLSSVPLAPWGPGRS